jgi:hypothetical protein
LRHKQLLRNCGELDKSQAELLGLLDCQGWDEDGDENQAVRFLFHPDRGVKVKWDVFFVVLIIYTAVTVPYKIGFDVEFTGLLYVLDTVVDVAYVLDMVLSFRTGYFDKRGKPVFDPAKIAKHYLRRSFALDLVASLPFDRVFEGLQLGVVAGLSRSVKLLRLLRLTRVLKLLGLIRFERLILHKQLQLEEELQVNNAVAAMLRMAFPVVLMGHLLGCFFHWLLVLHKGAANNWQAAVYGPDAQVSTGLAYHASVYWAFTTMTTTGYGDVTPVNDRERVLAMVAMIIGGSTFGYIVGNVTVIMEGVDLQSRALRERMDTVTGYMRERKLPQALYRRIRRHARYMLRKVSVHDTSAVLATLPFSVDARLSFVQHGELIGKIKHLHGLPVMLVALLAKRLKPMMALSGELVFIEGEVGTALYFLTSGALNCTLKVAGRRLKFEVLEPGSFLGEVRCGETLGGVRGVRHG